MRIVVTGREGQVVQSLCAIGPRFGVDILPVGRPELDLAVPASVLPAIAASRPDVIVSAAAYTAVDRAESEPETALAVNGDGAGAVAGAASSLGVPIIHLSTDYVFDGAKAEPYVETDPTGPLSVYGRSKLEGERQVAAATPNHAILRTCWVYSPYGANFVRTMLRLAESRDAISVVADQRGRPTSALDIAAAVIAVAERLVADPNPALRGVFHLAATGEATWADFAAAVFAGRERRGGSHVMVKPIATADYPTPARRPANSRLGSQKLSAAYGLVLPEWRQSLDTVLDMLLAEQGQGV